MWTNAKRSISGGWRLQDRDEVQPGTVYILINDSQVPKFSGKPDLTLQTTGSLRFRLREPSPVLTICISGVLSACQMQRILPASSKNSGSEDHSKGLSVNILICFFQVR